MSRETIVSARYILAVLMLAPFGLPNMTRRSPSRRPRREDWIALFLVGALGSGLGALLFTAALEHSSAGVVNSISKTAPIFVAFFGYLTLRERVTYSRLLLVGAMVGADVLIGIGELSFSKAEAQARLLGDGLALLAGLTRATSEILAKGALSRFSPSTVAIWRFGVGAAVTGAFALVTGAYREIVDVDARAITVLVLLAGVSTALSMYLYYRGMRQIPVHVAVSLKILGAVVTLIVSWVVLSETLNLYHVAGVGLLISGAYLLVIRTARETEGSGTQTPEESAPAPRAPRRDSSGRLRVRITLLVVAFSVATVIVSTVLSVRHTNAMIRQQVRLTMGKVAAVLVQLPGVDDPPSRHTMQQYLARVVRHRIQGEFYSVEIVYIALVDDTGNVLAFAVNEELALLDAGGRPIRAGDRRAARRLLDMANRGELARAHDIIPVRAELRRPGRDDRPIAVVEIGCKRSIANRVMGEIVARNALLVLVLVAIGVGLASTAARRMTNPLERIALAMRRLSGGELDMPIYSEGRGEIREMGDSLQAMRENLRMAGVLERALVRYAATQIRADLPGGRSPVGAEKREVAVLLIEVPRERFGDPGDHDDALLRFVEIVVSGVMQNEGEVSRYSDGVIVASWSGGGEEGVLWAALAALELRRRLTEADPDMRVVMGVEIAEVRVEPVGDGGDELSAVRERLLGTLVERESGAVIVLGPRAREAAGEDLIVRRHGAGPLWTLVGLTDAPELDGLAELAED